MQEMAVALAHEVKNPLSLVRASIDLLELDDSGEGHKNQFKIMKRELDKIGDLVQDLIGLAIPDAAKESIALSSFLGRLMTPFRETYEPGIRFLLDSPKDYPVKGSVCRLTLVFNNLLKNAVEAVQAAKNPEGRFISVGLSSPRDHGFVVVTIKDNGVGLPINSLDKLNQPFFTTKRGGTGVGLYISRAIVTQHGGSLDIQNNSRGGGCSVKVRLPLG